MQRIVTAAQTA